MSLAILFHFLCAQHVSDINLSIIRSLHLCCWITTSVALFSVRCALEIWCKLLMMDILMSETCSVHRKWNKIASVIKLVFYSSTITMMHGPINIRERKFAVWRKEWKKQSPVQVWFQLWVQCDFTVSLSRPYRKNKLLHVIFNISFNTLLSFSPKISGHMWLPSCLCRLMIVRNKWPIVTKSVWNLSLLSYSNKSNFF